MWLDDPFSQKNKATKRRSVSRGLGRRGGKNLKMEGARQ